VGRVIAASTLLGCSLTPRNTLSDQRTSPRVSGARAAARARRARALRRHPDVSPHHFAVAAPKQILQQQRPLDLRVLERVRIKAWDRLLFVECGDGWIVEETARRMMKGYVCGLSTSPQLLELAVQLRGVPGRVEFKPWDGKRFPLTSQSFDRVISCVPCGGYLEPGAVLREMARVLRPDGDLYLLESDSATHEAPQALCTTNVKGLLVQAGLVETQRDRTTLVVVHAHPCSAT